jgi:hypothetical protein
MPNRLPASLLVVLGLAVSSVAAAAEPETVTRLDDYDRLPGFIDMYWDAGSGRLLLAIEDFDEPFLYQSSLARGVGSNDLGLDRGQLGSARLVTFERAGAKILLVQHNLDYRASGEDSDERRAVEESFARSVLWGFEALGGQDGAAIVDATAFFLRDADGLAHRLAEAGEGDYRPDESRSAIWLPRTKAFPDNSEVEAVVTFTGKPVGEFLPTVVPDPTLVTVHLHHSFIRLPDRDYEPLPYDPRAGIIGLRYDSGGFLDYATGIGEPLLVAYGRRHRLEKRDPAAESSPAVEPIVYYVDRGAPEPVRSALIEGARWWNEAFEAAGYQDALRVELLPQGADPMDVRYNVIQWVHRSTRGWSYGSSVLDPRTGEILKGHVTLGSQRVRQDYMIAEGLLAPYGDEAGGDRMLEMSLARIRQLSAHEVGHTLGIEHNFAASTQERASVMDYPFPLIRFDGDGELDLSDAYGSGIGEWDKRVVLYAYQDFPEGVDAGEARERILGETVRQWKFVADADSRSVGTAHPDGNLWDNGADAIEELEHLLRVREHALGRFSAANVRAGRPLATLEDVLVPIYLLHRYQIEAVAKLIGGAYFNYALRGDGQEAIRPVDPRRQRAAIHALAGTLAPGVLRLPADLAEAIPPRPPGFARTRETFDGYTGGPFDPLAPADSAVALTLDALLEPTRAARLNRGHALDPDQPSFAEVLDVVLDASWFAPPAAGDEGVIRRATDTAVLHRLMSLAVHPEAATDVRSLALDAVYELDDWLEGREERESDRRWRAHYRDARLAIERMLDDPATIQRIVPVRPPPGAPIGAGPY